MKKIVIDLDKYVIYRHIPSASFIAFDLPQARKIRETLSNHGKIFHQIPEENKLTGQLLELDAKTKSYILSGNYEVAKLQDLEHLSISTRIILDIKKILKL